MTERARVIRLQFKLREAFPPDDPLSVPLLRLMAGANDVRYVQKSVLIALAECPAGVSEHLLREAELGYLLRMLAGHLHEAGTAFRDLDDHHAAAVDSLIAAAAHAQVELRRLRAIYRDDSASGVTKALLEGVRTPWAFHYKHERFKDALISHPEEATIIVSEYAGLGRYIVADDFAKQYIVNKVGGPKAFTEIVGEAINLAGTLGRVVDALLRGVFEGREDKLLIEEHDEEVIVSPSITRTRRDKGAEGDT